MQHNVAQLMGGHDLLLGRRKISVDPYEELAQKMEDAIEER